MIEIDVSDELTPLTQYMLNNNKKTLARMTKSVGYFTQKEIKKGVRTGSPNGETWRSRIPWNIRRAVQDGHAPTSWYGQMKNAIGYQYENYAVKIGWTSRTSASYGRKQESGYKTLITGLVREKWAKAGYPLSHHKDYLITPPRPIFEPMMRAIEPQIAPYIENKLNDYINNSVTFSKRSRRKYKVY